MINTFIWHHDVIIDFRFANSPFSISLSIRVNNKVTDCVVPLTDPRRVFIFICCPPSCRPLTLWTCCFLAKPSVTSFGFLFPVTLNVTFRDKQYLKILSYSRQWLGTSQRGQFEVFLHPPFSHPCLPAPLHCMSVWITVSASACSLVYETQTFL